MNSVCNFVQCDVVENSDTGTCNPKVPISFFSPSRGKKWNLRITKIVLTELYNGKDGYFFLGERGIDECYLSVAKSMRHAPNVAILELERN